MMTSPDSGISSPSDWAFALLSAAVEASTSQPFQNVSWPSPAAAVVGSTVNPRAASIADYACQNQMRFIIQTLLAGVICVVGFAGNCASYTVLGSDRDMLPVARFLLRSLAVADSFFIVAFFVNLSLVSVFRYSGLESRAFDQAAWNRSLLVSYPFIFVAQTATIWLTVLIAASRCLSVCWPQKSGVYCSLSATRLGVAGVALFSVVYNVPRWFESQNVAVPIRNGTATRYELHRTQLGQSYAYQLVYFDTLYYVVLFALPLLLLTVFNTKLILVYRRFRRKRKALQAAHAARGRRRLADSSEQNVTLIMIVVILVFTICNVPARVVQLVWRYQTQRCMTAQFFFSELSTVFELLGSAVNFFVYLAFLRRFRHRICSAVCPRLWRGGHADLHGQGTATTGDETIGVGGGGAVTMVRASLGGGEEVAMLAPSPHQLTAAPRAKAAFDDGQQQRALLLQRQETDESRL